LPLNILSSAVNNQSPDFVSGVAALVGRPSSGKSSLVNALCGAKVSIVSPVPQTTRNAIRGIVSDSRGQIVLLDTPGYHLSEKSINLHMRSLVDGTVSEADALLYLIDSSRMPGDEEEAIARLLAERALPTVVVATKCDLPSRIDAASFCAEHGLTPRAIVETRGLDDPETADRGASGVAAVVDAVLAILPEGPPWYPEEFYTDQDPTFRIAEIVRERAILRTRDEVPHAIYVEVADIEETEREYRARVFLYVERESQKGILVGRGASVVSAIRTESQRILGELFPKPVRLSLQVKVRPKWRHNEALLKKLIR